MPGGTGVPERDSRSLNGRGRLATAAAARPFPLLARQRPSEQNCPNGNRGVGNVEHPKAKGRKSDIDEIDDPHRRAEAVEEIARRASPRQSERKHSNPVAGARAASRQFIESIQDHQRDDCKCTEDRPRISAQRHAECGARIIRESKPHDVAENAMRNMARRQIALCEELSGEIGRDDAGRSAPKERPRDTPRTERLAQTKSPASEVVDVWPGGAVAPRGAE